MCVSVKMNSIEIFTLVTGDADEKATRRRKARGRNIVVLRCLSSILVSRFVRLVRPHIRR